MALIKPADMARLNEYFSVGIKRYKFHARDYFRKAVWHLFEEILLETPQFTGRGVANWNLSVGAPDYTFEPWAGDDQHLTAAGNFSHAGVRQKGDFLWIDYAVGKNEHKLDLIELDSVVYITNAAIGDDDHGRSSEMYIDSLQDPAYWAQKLRAANKPYETVAEIVIRMNNNALNAGKVPALT